MPITFSLEELKELLGGTNSILVIGPATTGKTSSLATLCDLPIFKANPKLEMHYKDFDFKVNPLIRLLEKRGQLHRLKVSRYAAPSGDRLGQTQQFAKQTAPFLDFIKDYNSYFDHIDPKTGKWRADYANPPGVIIFDSLTSFSDLVLEFVLGTVGHSIGDVGTDARSDFGRQMEKIMETIKSSKTLPCITVWLAHDQLIQDEKTGEISNLPLVTGKLAYRLAKEFTTVLYSLTNADGKGNIRYEWLTRPKGSVRSAGTTDRDDLPLYIEQDFTKVLGRGE